jgi:SAM-dependent methyltransferase
MYKVRRLLRNYISLGSVAQLLMRPHTLMRLPAYFVQLYRYRCSEAEQTGRRTPLRVYPCLRDAQPSQPTKGYYFYQDCWAARQVFREEPDYFVDVGSTVLFVGILSQFRPGISVDLRPIEANLDGLDARGGSVFELPFDDGTVPCLTTLCVLEHVGLGRYGDQLNPLGTLEAVEEIKRVIAPGGIVVYSVPVGREMTEFNAGRRFTFRQAATLFGDWDLLDSCVLTPVPEPFTSDEALLELHDPVGCFCMRKPLSSPDGDLMSFASG